MNPFSRRKLLVSTGASFLLKPFIDCALARADGPVLKPAFVTMFKGQCSFGGSPGGGDSTANAKNWMPTLEGGELKLAPLLAPFEKVKDYMTFVVGLDYAGSPADWHWSCATLYTGTNNRGAGNKERGSDYESLDYIVAKRQGGEPLVVNPYQPFIETKDGFYVSWGRDAGGKLFKKMPYGDPLKLFNDLFGGGPLPGAPGTDVMRQAALERSRKSMLDAIREDAARVRTRIAPEHRVQIDGTLDGIRQLETSLVGKDGKPSDAMMQQCAPLAKGEAAPGKDVTATEANLTKTFNALIDVTLMAMRCGLRSSISFQFLDVLSQHLIPAKLRPEWKHQRVGVTPYHFDHTHFPAGKIWTECEQYIHGFYARFLEGMAAIPAGNSNLLEKSIGVYATTMSHNHSSNAAGFFVVGNMGGAFKSKRILEYGNPYTNRPSGKPHNDLLISMMHAYGYTDVKTVGDPRLCKGVLPGFLTS